MLEPAEHPNFNTLASVEIISIIKTSHWLCTCQRDYIIAIKENSFSAGEVLFEFG